MKAAYSFSNFRSNSMTSLGNFEGIWFDQQLQFGISNSELIHNEYYNYSQQVTTTRKLQNGRLSEYTITKTKKSKYKQSQRTRSSQQFESLKHKQSLIIQYSPTQNGVVKQPWKLSRTSSKRQQIAECPSIDKRMSQYYEAEPTLVPLNKKKTVGKTIVFGSFENSNKIISDQRKRSSRDQLFQLNKTKSHYREYQANQQLNNPEATELKPLTFQILKKPDLCQRYKESSIKQTESNTQYRQYNRQSYRQSNKQYNKQSNRQHYRQHNRQSKQYLAKQDNFNHDQVLSSLKNDLIDSWNMGATL